MTTPEPNATAAVHSPDRRARLTRRVRLLVAATITYNIVEAVVAIGAGAVASSTALIGSGLDSVIEVASAAAVAWQFSGKDPEARERRAGRERASASAVADFKQTLLCTYLSGVLLAGLLLNSLIGWSWADPIAALFIAAIAVKEGRSAWKGETCCPATAAIPAASACEHDTGTSRRTERAPRRARPQLLHLKPALT
jgi:divalent metal cation (Fe/Co/Zn/Cd) transporter